MSQLFPGNRVAIGMLSAVLLVSSGAAGFGQIITNFTPRFGVRGTTERITLLGTGFYPGTIQVRFYNNQLAGVHVNTPNEITVTNVPAGAISGPIGIRKNGGAWADTVDSFTVIGAGPFVTNFFPIVGQANELVTIEGVHFYNGAVSKQVSSVSFNGVNGTGLHIESNNRLTVRAPANVTSGPIRLVSSLGTFVTTTNGAFCETNFYVPAKLTGFSPSSGRAGTNVVISGANLLGVTGVTFNGVPAAFEPTTNNTTLRVSVPAGAGTGHIIVTTPASSVESSSNFVVRPTVTSILPASGGAGTAVVISGENLLGPTNVSFGGVKSSTVTGVSFGQLTATVPAGALTGPVTISTTNGTATSPQIFYAPPIITTFTPKNGGPDTIVEIRGTNFTGATAVSINGSPAFFTVSNNFILHATVPAGVITGPISVTTPAGVAESGESFSGLPLVYDFSPIHGLPGTRVTIQGTNFAGASQVLFGGMPGLGLVATNNGLLGVTVPSNAKSGPLTVVAAGGTNSTALGFTVDYSSDLEVRTTAPLSVRLGNTFTYQIVITNKGPFDAPNVTLSDTIPAAVTFKFGSITQGTLNTGGNPITASLGTLSASNTATVTLTVEPQVITSLTNFATVTLGHTDPVTTNNTSVAVTEIFLPAELSAEPTAEGFQISWSAALAGYQLQYKSSLGSGGWSNVAAPKTIVGDRWTVTDPMEPGNRFYRLKK